MKSLNTLIVAGIAATFIAPAHAYERCKSFQNSELKAMTIEGLEKAYCWNEDRLIEILEVVRLSKSEEAKREGDACWETLIKLSAQPKFERQEKCPDAIPAGASTGREETKQRQRDLLRNLGIAGEKETSTK
jgi:hypothetical protein